MAKNVRRIVKREESAVHIPVQDAVQDYLQDPKIKKLSPRTREEYEHELGVFVRWCSAHAILQKNKQWLAMASDDEQIWLHQINDQVVYLFIEHVRTTHKPSRSDQTEISTYTLHGYVRVIKSFLNWSLMDDQYCDQVKAITIKRISTPEVIETIIETFSTDQIDALFKACDQQESEHLQLRDRAIVATLLDSGIRASELITLTIAHVSLNPKDAHIRVFGKGKKWGEVGIGEQTRRYLQKYIRMFREPTVEYEIQHAYKNTSPRQLTQTTKQEMQHAFLFVNRSGAKLTRSGLYQIVDRLGATAQIEDVRCSPHTFRHTFAVNFIRQGGDIYTLSKLLRHSSVKVTEEYLKSLKQSEARRGAKSVLDNI